MWPLDGGVPSLRRARTPARGRGAEPLFFSLGHRGRLLLRLILRGALRDEREGEGVNDLGFREPAAGWGFVSPRRALVRPIWMDGADQGGAVPAA